MSSLPPASSGPWATDPPDRTEPAGIDASLHTLLAHAEFLRLGPRLACPADPGLLGWPMPPTPVGAGGRRRWAIAAAVTVMAGLILYGAVDLAMSVSGSPPRPVLVGHKLGYPWNIGGAPGQQPPAP